MSKSRQYILIFSIPKKEFSFRKKIERTLKKSKAKKLRGGVWIGTEVSIFLKISELVRLIGGSSYVFEVQRLINSH